MSDQPVKSERKRQIEAEIDDALARRESGEWTRDQYRDWFERFLARWERPQPEPELAE